MILALKLFLLSWFITHFEPLQDLFLRIYQKVDQKSPMIVIIDGVHNILSCFMCASFWFVLFGTWNLWFAIGGSMIASVWMKLFN
jgi:hypothetical protein